MTQLSPLQMLAMTVAASLLLLAFISPVFIQQYLVISATESKTKTTLPIWPLPDNEVAARKARLINTLLPAIQKNNQQLSEQRQRISHLQKLHSNGRLPETEVLWLTNLATRYLGANEDEVIIDDLLFEQLLQHVDIVPADLALAQGAIESGWGTSRFSREGNNYFGQWCYQPGCGMVPARRASNARHEVQRFSSPADSVQSYMLNLNRHFRYEEFRLKRADLRQRGKRPKGILLVSALDGYAQDENYVSKLHTMIRSNELDAFVNH